MEKEQIKELEAAARKIRRTIVSLIGPGKPGHLGGACSLADIVAVLYFYKMKHDPQNPLWEGRDRFILSKGHGALVQYAALMEGGYFDKEKSIPTLKKLGSRLQGHPDMRKLPGIEANTGSLGQGVSLGAGLAAGLRLNGSGARVYVAVGDGELAEGQLWEAFMSAAAFRLDHLTVIIDRNGLQATGKTSERFPIHGMEEKMKAFGFETKVINGHSIPEIADALNWVDTVKEKPTVIIADTVKGKGIPFAEHVVGFHNGAMSKEQFDEALKVLEKEV